MRYKIPTIQGAIHEVVDRMERVAVALRALSPIYHQSVKRSDEGYKLLEDEVKVIESYSELSAAYETLKQVSQGVVSQFMSDFDVWRKTTFSNADSDAYFGTARGGPSGPTPVAIDLKAPLEVADLEGSLGESLNTAVAAAKGVPAELHSA